MNQMVIEENVDMEIKTLEAGVNFYFV